MYLLNYLKRYIQRKACENEKNFKTHVSEILKI